MKTIPWQPGFTWRKLGYITQSSSLAYREVIEDNPGWDVVTEPAIGTVIRLSDTNQMGQIDSLPVGPGGSSAQVAAEVFPFETYADYVSAIARYSTGALMNTDRTNGFSMDSAAAVTGIQ